MEEGDVQAFEIVLDVQGPVPGDLEIAVARRIVTKLVERQPRQARADVAEEGFERRRGRERGERLPRERAERNARQMVRGSGEVLRLLEAGHEGHAAREIEAPRVVAAADLLGPAGPVHQDVAAVRADVRQAAQLAGGVARQQERLVEVPGQHLARRERARRGDVAEVAEPLPGAREHALARQRMDRRIEIEGARQGARPGDVGVDGEGEFHRDQDIR